MTMQRAGRVSGRDAVRIMAEEIGVVIGNRRLQAFERKVRERMAEQGMTRAGTANDWINAMANIIVENDDAQADVGFRKGIRRIREQAARQ